MKLSKYYNFFSDQINLLFGFWLVSRMEALLKKVEIASLIPVRSHPNGLLTCLIFEFYDMLI